MEAGFALVQAASGYVPVLCGLCDQRKGTVRLPSACLSPYVRLSVCASSRDDTITSQRHVTGLAESELEIIMTKERKCCSLPLYCYMRLFIGC